MSADQFAFNFEKKPYRPIKPGKCCRCAAAERVKGQGYCRDCLRAYRREYRQRWTENSRVRDAIRNSVRKRVRQGKLKRGPCAVCGEKKVEAHHPDYRQPFEVVWLCKRHHVELEREKRDAYIEEKK